MKTTALKLVYFSPTGTTKAVLQSIADGMASDSVEHIDITKPETRERPLQLSGDDTLIIGAPVYMGRIPALLQEWLNALQAGDTPVVCVVVYGNREYEDALLELKNTVTSSGCIPIACAAYIGEHSFSTPEAPTAQGRPDKSDLEHAQDFGRKIRKKLESAPTIAQLPEVAVPGQYPYGGMTKLWDVDFISVDERCVQCGICAKVCPVGAVDARDSAQIDIEKCITCCACLKQCPQQARSMKPGPVKEAQKRLNSLFNEPKQPECFL